MIATIPINLLRLVLLLAVQVLVFSNIHLSPMTAIYIYPLFIFLLPFETPRWLLLMLGFGFGLLLDVFLGTMGMHAAANTLLAYLRPYLIKIITPTSTEFEISPSIYLQGAGWFLIYCGIGTLVHLLFYFLLESGTFYNLFYLLLRTVLSTALSVMFMMIFMYLFASSKKRRMT
ncbi:MAG: rod shape-determining protein MreD [Chitinophagales bacterium]